MYQDTEEKNSSLEGSTEKNTENDLIDNLKLIGEYDAQAFTEKLTILLTVVNNFSKDERIEFYHQSTKALEINRRFLEEKSKDWEHNRELQKDNSSTNNFIKKEHVEIIKRSQIIIFSLSLLGIVSGLVFAYLEQFTVGGLIIMAAVGAVGAAQIMERIRKFNLKKNLAENPQDESNIQS